MSEGSDLPAWAQPRRSEERPVWVVVLALAMLVLGGGLLTSGISQLTDPDRQRAFNPNDPVQVIKDQRAVSEAVARVYREHPGAVRVNALSWVVMGLALLFAVAAVFSSDSRARHAALLAAWLGMPFYVGNVVFYFLIYRKGVIAAAPALMNLVARQQTGTRPTASAVVSGYDVVIVGLCTLGMLFSVVLLTFFGGRRGRTFFGAGADLVRRQPNHGG